MDVANFFEACGASQPELHKWLSSGLQIVEEALHIYKPEELCFSFNGGKDCTVVLHLIRAALHRRSRTAEKAVDDTSAGLGIRVVYFDSSADFPEVAAFMAQCEQQYGFTIEHLPGFRAGLESLISRGVRAVLMGTRHSDPDGARMRGPFAPTSLNWPACMRVCPVLDWPYAAVWDFLRSCSLPYCTLYDAGYTSLGSPSTCSPNPALATGQMDDKGQVTFLPAWHLNDEKLERLGRHKAPANVPSAPVTSPLVPATPSPSLSPPPTIPTAAMVVVGDEILSGRVHDSAVAFVGTELTRLGRRLAHVSVVPDDIHAISSAVSSARASGHSHVFVTGGLGPTHDDVTLAGVAHAFGCSLAPSPAMLALLHALHGTARIQACPALSRMAMLPDTPAASLVYGDGTRVSPPSAGIPQAWQHKDGESQEEGRRDWVKRGYPLLLLAGCVAVFPGVPSILRRKWATFHPLLFGHYPVARTEEAALRLMGCAEADIADVLQQVSLSASASAAAAGVSLSIGSYPANVDSFSLVQASSSGSGRGLLGEAKGQIVGAEGSAANGSQARSTASPPNSPMHEGASGAAVIVTVTAIGPTASPDAAQGTTVAVSGSQAGAGAQTGTQDGASTDSVGQAVASTMEELVRQLVALGVQCHRIPAR